jgi:hypothetical protein
MLLSLLLTVFTAPQAAPTQTSAVDYFPADTLAVADFSLEPWDRLRKNTVAHPLLKELEVLRTFSDQLQLEIEGEKSLGDKFDLRKVLAESRFYIGLPATTLPAGHLLLGVDALKVNLNGDFGVILDRLKVPYARVGTSILAIVYVDEFSKIDDEDAQLVLKQYIAAATSKGQDGSVPYTLTNQKSWQKLQAAMASDSRIAGLWIPSEPWRDGHWRKLVDRYAGDDPEFGMMMSIFSKIITGMGIDQLEGYAMVSEVAVPFIQERMVILGDGPLLNMYRPYSTDPAACWARLEQCDGASITSGVGGVDVNGLVDMMVTLMSEVFVDMVGVDLMEDPEAKPYIDAILNVVATLGPGFVTEASMDQMDLTGQAQMTISVNNMEKAKQSIADMPVEIVAAFQMGLAQYGGAFPTEWGEDSIIMLRDPNLTGEKTLADTSAFQQALPVMKKFVGGDDPVWLTYYSPTYDAYFLSTIGESVEFFADLFDLGVLIDFSKLGSVTDLEPRMHPGFAVMTRNANGLELRSRSTFGFIFPTLGIAARTMAQQLSDAGLEFEEDEF